MTTRADAAAFRAGLSEARCAFGTFATLGSSAAVEFAAADGLDFVAIDCQHGLAGPTELAGHLRAMSAHRAIPIVRVPAGDDAAIERALDVGAAGVIVPAVESGDRAAEVASRCRYPPSGTRSFGPVRSDLLFGLDPCVANEHVLCLVMIETRAGLEACEEICATPGVDGIFIGPADLAVSLGLPPSPDITPGEHAEAVAAIRRAASRHGRFVGIHAGTGAQAAARAADGFAMVTIGTDATLLRWAFSHSAKTARAASSAV